MKRNNISTMALIVAMCALALSICAVNITGALTKSAPEPTPTPTPDPLDIIYPTPDPLDTIDPTPEPDWNKGIITKDVPDLIQPEQGRYGYLTDDEIETLARLVYLEARGESFEGQQAVAEVVLNRVLAPSFPNNVYDVIYQSGQFTPAGNIPYTTATQTQYDAISAALSGPNILPQQVLYFAQGPNGRTNVWGWIGRHCFCY